jgi:hypothetical protein
MDRLWRHHFFTFTAQDDQWESSTSRTGIPLNNSGERWALLEDFAPTMKLSEKNPRIIVAPEDEVLRGRTGAFGGLPTTQAAYVKFSAKSLLPSCPRIVEEGYGSKYIWKLRKFINKPTEEITSEESLKMFQWILWREDQLTWADDVVAHLGLPMPDGQKVRIWNTAEWTQRNGHLRDLVAISYDLLKAAKIFPQTDPLAFPYTYRPQSYVQAALALGCKSEAEMEENVRAIAKLRDEIARADAS